MIAWAAPAFGFALLAAAVPVVIHLLRRPSGVAVEVPGVRHFEASLPRESGAERLRRWLLLAARSLAVALLVLAFTRPVWLGGEVTASLAAGGTGNAGSVGRAVLLLVDTSGSTAQVDARGVVAAEAIADAADRELARLRPGVDAAAVLLVGVGVEPVLPEFSRNLGVLRERLAARLAEPGAVAGVADWRGAVGRAGTMTRAAAATLGGLEPAAVRLVVLTDRQAGDWAPLAARPGAADAAATDVAVEPGLGAALPNARLAVEEVVAPVGAQPAEVRLRVDVTPGDGRGGDLPAALGLAVGNTPVGQLRGDDPAGWVSTPTVVFEGGALDRAVRLSLASALADGLPADDAAEARIPALRRVSVAVAAADDPRRPLTGETPPTAADYLWRALEPDAARARFDLSWWRAGDPPPAPRGSLLVLTGAPGEPADAAEAFAAGGGGGVVRFATPGAPGWEAFDRDPPALVISAAPTPLAAALLAGLDDRAGAALGGLRWSGRADLRPEASAPGADVLIRWADGRPAAVWRPVPRLRAADGDAPAPASGGVLSFGFALSARDGSLPQRGVFVGLVRGAVDALGRRVVGEPEAAEDAARSAPATATDSGDLRRSPVAEVEAAAGALWAAQAGVAGGRPAPTATAAGAAARAGLGSPLFGWAVLGVAALVLLEIALQRRAAGA